jgi:dipeptidyl aminopeptidase/acylaminoacyl peptidase
MLKSDPWDPAGALWTRSPLSLAANVATPVFLYVNEGDLRCPPSQADEFYAALKWHGKEVEYVRYPGGSHFSFLSMVGAPSQSTDRVARGLDFLRRHGGSRVRSAGLRGG